MPILLFLACLLLLWAFIAWDRRRSAPPIAHQSLEKGWAPRPTKKWPLTLGLSLCSFSMAFAEWLQPDMPPFTGKFSFLKQYAYDCFGSVGAAYLWGMVGIACLAGAAIQWRNRAMLSDGQPEV